MLVLSGILIIVIGFVLGFNPLLVVTIAGFASAVAAGHSVLEVVGMLGKAFVQGRFMAVAWLSLPMLGVLERSGLRERARTLMRQFGNVSADRVLIGYLGLRQLTAALGLTSLGGHVQMVRPILAPMVEAAEESSGQLDEDTRLQLRAHAAAADNIGVFFGEDVFVAVGSILLICGFMQQNGIEVSTLGVAKWAAPTAVGAFCVHGLRLHWLGRTLRRRRLAK